MSSKPRGIDSPTEDGFATHLSNGPSRKQENFGGEEMYPMQTPSNALGTKIVEGHLDDGDKPSNPRQGSRGSVDRSVTSDAMVKTQ